MNAACRIVLTLMLVPFAAHAADGAPDAQRFTLREAQPEVAWFDSSGWALAPGYPKLGDGRSVEAPMSDAVSSRRFVALPPGGSVVVRFTKKEPFATRPEPGTTVEMSFTQTRVKVRSTYYSSTYDRTEQYDFDVSLTNPPEANGPGDPFEFSASGTASKSVPNPSSDAEAGLGVGVSEGFSDDIQLRGFPLGDRTGGWIASGSATQKGVGRQPLTYEIDWSDAGFEFDCGMRVRLEYRYGREPRPAIVFLPGVAGSVLDSLNALGRFEVWPTASVSNRANLALEPDGRTPAVKGAMIRVGGVLRSAPTNFYGGLIDFLAGKGWKEDEDLFVFPYDWRLDNRDHFERLDQVMRKAAREDEPQKKRKVVLIAHSMGGVISRAYLLSNAERCKNVKGFISIATPYFGAPKVFYGFANGYSFGNPTVRSELMKVLIQNLPAAYQLVPWEPFVTEGNRALSLDETYSIRYRGFTDAQLDILRDAYTETVDTPWFMNPGLVAAAKGFRNAQGGKRSAQGLGVPHHVIIGTGVKTLASYTLEDAKDAAPGLRLGARGVRLEPVFLDGDGTVPLWSLEIAGATRTYYVPYVSKIGSDISSGHGDLPANPAVQDIVARILAGKPPPPGEFRRSTELIDLEGLDVALHSNATLSIEGSGGRLGLNAAGAVEETLPTGTMLFTEGGEYASIGALDRAYTAVVNGTGTGEFTLDVSIRSAAGSVAYRYPKVSVEAGTVARVPIDPRAAQAPAPLSVVTGGRTTQVFPTMLAAPAPVAPPAAPEAPVAASAPPAAPPVVGIIDRVPPAVGAQPTAGMIAVRSATYGRNCKAAEGNVTAHAAKACDGKAACSYRIDHTQIGDPAYGCQKDYFIDWSCGGEETFLLGAAPEAGFGSVVELSCPPPPKAVRATPSRPPPPVAARIAVLGATYGANCGVPANNVTAHARQACDGRDRCDYRVDHTLIGDPAYGCQKDYSLDWSCGGAQRFTVKAAPEAGFGSVVTLSCPPPADAIRIAGSPPAAQGVPAPAAGPAQTITLAACPYGFEEYRGKRTALICTCSGADAGYDGRLYGTDVYTDDSYICRAAVHAGAIDAIDGGTVRVVPAPGRGAYASSERNGVRSGTWGAWGGSYRIERGP